jgi:hypothetical protein
VKKPIPQPVVKQLPADRGLARETKPPAPGQSSSGADRRLRERSRMHAGAPRGMRPSPWASIRPAVRSARAPLPGSLSRAETRPARSRATRGANMVLSHRLFFECFYHCHLTNRANAALHNAHSRWATPQPSRQRTKVTQSPPGTSHSDHRPGQLITSGATFRQFSTGRSAQKISHRMVPRVAIDFEESDDRSVGNSRDALGPGRLTLKKTERDLSA